MLLAVVGVTVALQRATTPDNRGAGIVRERFHSDLLARDLEQIVVLPRGFDESDRRPLLVVLHGRGDSPAGRLNDPLLAALAAAGDDAPVVLLANGGESSYYHDRSDGPWGAYLSDELIPDVVERFSLDGRRTAVAGISMGGFGALEWVRRSGQRQCAVAAMAPALWANAADTPAGAFDDAEDFEEHDLLGEVGADAAALHSTPVYLTVGTDDPFRASTAELAAALEEGGTPVQHVVAEGGHNSQFWDGQIDEVMRWVDERLARC